jgi:hypothetical protein
MCVYSWPCPIAFKISNKCLNAGMPGENIVRHRHFYRQPGPALAFCHQDQSSTAGHGVVRHGPAMLLVIEFFRE